MRDRPDGARLLQLARTVLLEELLPALPETERYTARLVANAVAIAARELAAGETPLRAERSALAKLFGEDKEATPTRGETESLAEALQRLTWRLTAEIRAGGRDADRRVHELLRESVARRLRESNPRVLGDGRREKAGQ